MTLVLETLGSDQALDARSLGVGLGTLLLGLDLTADDELADLFHDTVSILVQLRLGPQDGESLDRRRWKGGYPHHHPC